MVKADCEPRLAGRVEPRCSVRIRAYLRIRHRCSHSKQNNNLSMIRWSHRDGPVWSHGSTIEKPGEECLESRGIIYVFDLRSVASGNHAPGQQRIRIGYPGG